MRFHTPGYRVPLTVVTGGDAARESVAIEPASLYAMITIDRDGVASATGASGQGRVIGAPRAGLAKGNPSDPSFLAVDQVQSGIGDLVLVMTEGNGARQILKEKVLPIRSIVVGVVDAVDAVANARVEGAAEAR